MWRERRSRTTRGLSQQSLGTGVARSQVLRENRGTSRRPASVVRVGRRARSLRSRLPARRSVLTGPCQETCTVVRRCREMRCRRSGRVHRRGTRRVSRRGQSRRIQPQRTELAVARCDFRPGTDTGIQLRSDLRQGRGPSANGCGPCRGRRIPSTEAHPVRRNASRLQQGLALSEVVWPLGVLRPSRENLSGPGAICRSSGPHPGRPGARRRTLRCATCRPRP